MRPQGATDAACFARILPLSRFAGEAEHLRWINAAGCRRDHHAWCLTGRRESGKALPQQIVAAEPMHRGEEAWG